MTVLPSLPRPVSTAGVPLGDVVPGAPLIVATGVSLDSRRLVPGDLYAALPGASTHGARFAALAVSGGAVAVLTDPAGAAELDGLGVPVIQVPDPRSEAARVAAAVYGHPADRLAMFGITGTTGKTCTTCLVEAGLAAAGMVTGTIGTLGFQLAGEPLVSDRSTITTPEAPDLQALLAVMLERGATAVAMEVSSHALDQHRVDGITFDVAAFTNLGQDHLDYHGDLESYFEAKSRLFLGGQTREAVISIDDPWGRRLVTMIEADGGARVHTTGNDPAADYRVVSCALDAAGRSRVRLATPAREVGFELGMLGSFNVTNAVTAVAMLYQGSVDLDAALSGLAGAVVPGRMERVPLAGDAPNVVVDFAHTPEAVAAALSALPAGRRIAVLGCGGDRDAGKRGPMGAAAARFADLVVVTDDNPRSEDPAAIREAVLAGARAAASRSGAEVIDGGDRRSAIRTALRAARPGEWIAILGKGHEQGQEIGGVVSPFSDVVVAREEWQAANGGGEQWIS